MNHIEDLASQLLHHKKLYYQGKSTISDAEYDALEDELRKLSPNHPILSLVGYQFPSTAQKVAHPVAMLSLAKTYSLEDLKAFLDAYPCIAIDKFDGMALALEYDEHGNLTRASTRGNGKFGEDVTEHVYYITSIAKKLSQLPSSQRGIRFEVRGEVYFPLLQFKNFAERFDSFRNAVPGTLGRKEVGEAVDVLKVLRFCPYDLLAFTEGNKVLSAQELAKTFQIKPDYWAKLNFIHSLGFGLHENHMSEASAFADIDALKKYIDNWYAQKRDHQIDGIVFRVRDEVFWESLGNTAHHPRGSLAFKQAGETAFTEILGIEENVGRSGKITFRAQLKPVYLSGAKISYATLHNAEFIESGSYAVGAEVEIIRSGEVIPAIIRLIKPAQQAYKLPEKCLCGSVLVRQGPDLMCKNPTCTYKDQEALVHFVSSLNIDGVSDKTVLKLREGGFVQEPADFYKLTAEILAQIEGFAKKSSDNVIAAIQKANRIPLAEFLTALGLKRGGAVKCQEVARKYVSLTKVLALEAEELTHEKGWAKKSAEDFVQSLSEKKQIIQNLLAYVTVLDDHSEDSRKAQSGHAYFGKQICITGALSRPREEYKVLLEQVGAKLVSSVSSNTALLVCNEASSSKKYQEALKLKVPIITEEEFISQLNS